MTRLDRELRRILRESARGTFRESSGYPVTEANDCHSPAGSPGGGQFCSSKGGQPATGDRARVSQDWRNAMQSAGLRTDRPGRVSKSTRGWVASDWASFGYGDVGTAPKPKKVSHKMTAPTTPSGPQHVGDYRGMEIHTLPSYTTPYYFVNAPGFGSMQHSPSLTRIKRQIDTFKDTGVTAHRAERAKASARYQKRKARGR